MSVYISSGSSKFVTEAELQADLKRYSTNAYVDGLITPIESEITTLTTDVTNLQTCITQVIFQPGGVTNPATNTFASWPALCTFVYNCNPNGAVNILIDDLISGAQIPAGSYQLPPFVTFTGINKPGNLGPMSGFAQGTILGFAPGTSITFPNGCATITLDGIVFDGTGATSTIFDISTQHGTTGTPGIWLTNNSVVASGGGFLGSSVTMFSITTPYSSINLNNGSVAQGTSNTIPLCNAFVIGSGCVSLVTVNDTSQLLLASIYPNTALAASEINIDAAAFVDPSMLTGTVNYYPASAASLRLVGSTSHHGVSVTPAASTAAYPLVLPAAQGGVSTTLQNDGAGNLTWVSGGGGGISTMSGDVSAVVTGSNAAVTINKIQGTSVSGASASPVINNVVLYDSSANVNANVVSTSTLKLNGATSGSVLLEPASTTTPYSLVLPGAVPTAAGQSLTSIDSSGNFIYSAPGVVCAVYQPGGTANAATNTFTSFQSCCDFLYALNPKGACQIIVDCTNVGGTGTIPVSGTAYNLPPYVELVGYQLPSIELIGNVVFTFPNALTNFTIQDLDIETDTTPYTTPWITSTIPGGTAGTNNTISLINSTVANGDTTFAGCMIKLDSTTLFLKSNSNVIGNSGTLGFSLGYNPASASNIYVDATSQISLGGLDLTTTPLPSSINLNATTGARIDPTVLVCCNLATPYASATTGAVVIYDNTGSTANTASIMANNHIATSYSLNMPTQQATGVMMNDGAGNLSFQPNLNTSIGSNTLVGLNAGNSSMTSTDFCVCVGKGAGQLLGTLGGGTNDCTLVGYNAGNALLGSASVNTAIGYEALSLGGSASACTAVGASALLNCTASNNVAIGGSSGRATTSGTDNVSIGTLSYRDMTTGSSNVAIGFGNMTTGAVSASSNTSIGFQAGIAGGAYTAPASVSGNLILGASALTLTSLSNTSAGTFNGTGGQLVLGSATSPLITNTKASAGGTGALPATVLGYLIVVLNGIQVRIPYYPN